MATKRETLIRFANAEIFGRGNLDVIEQVFTTDYLAHGGGKEFSGLPFIRHYLGLMLAAISEVRVVEVTIFAEAGDTVTWQRTLTGTNTGAMMGIPASGKSVTWREMLVSRFDGDKIAEEWLVSELAGELFSKQGGGKG